jgi:hypothetical protein
MSAISSKHFDTLEYVTRAKTLGATEEMAVFQAKQIQHAIEIAIQSIESKELATKKDLEITKLELKNEIVNSLNTIILWVVAVILASSTIPAILQHWLK